MSIRKLKNSIGKKVRFLRLEKGLSQEKLAESVNMSREHISCIERGKNFEYSSYHRHVGTGSNCKLLS